MSLIRCRVASAAALLVCRPSTREPRPAAPPPWPAGRRRPAPAAPRTLRRFCCFCLSGAGRGEGRAGAPPRGAAAASLCQERRSASDPKTLLPRPAPPRTAHSPGARSVPPPGHFSAAAAARKAVGQRHEEHSGHDSSGPTRRSLSSPRGLTSGGLHRTVLHRPPTGALTRGGAGEARARRGEREAGVAGTETPAGDTST
ncbi:hypothetical protein E2C01_047179 [Portunus trituberculatus]|uniref:Uncharacterized protein n=1 Tax=Portunus trituberculatus TaxID=210409 RepID=A0A5B7G0F8_PORTR|nr:hypothetical protein [Portunus trituberculatus]